MNKEQAITKIYKEWASSTENTLEVEKEIRKMINKVKSFGEFLNEGTINDFKYDAVKNQLQKAINNNSLTLDDISPNKYFIVCFDLYNHHISTVSTTDKSEALKHIDYYKNIDDVWKIYVEKPNVDAIVFLRKEWGWVKK